MTKPNKHEINSILKKILFPDGSSMLERASEPAIREDNIAFTLDISGHNRNTGEKIQQVAIQQINKLYSKINVNIVLTSTKKAAQDTDTHSPEVDSKSRIHIDGVNKVIVVTSGKGGVGKSTMAALLAHKLKNEGKKVGILDADIYGPSIPRIFNVNSKPELDDKKMVPLESFGIKLNSIGFITAEGASISWRGPMVSKALYQLISLTKWGNSQENDSQGDDTQVNGAKKGTLDYLIIDMPPGTGDIHISLLENYAIDGVIFVTTPQAISEIDVARSISLYQKFDVEILGIIENMGHVIDPDNGKKINLFPGSGGKNISAKYSIPILSSIPLIPGLSQTIDDGKDLAEYCNLIKRI